MCYKGVGVSGLTAEINESKTLIVAPGFLLEIEPFSFQATCRWLKISESGEIDSGFEITFVSSSDRAKLQKMIQLTSVFL